MKSNAKRQRNNFEAVRVAESALEDFIGAAKVDPAELLEQGDKHGQ